MSIRVRSRRPLALVVASVRSNSQVWCPVTMRCRRFNRCRTLKRVRLVRWAALWRRTLTVFRVWTVLARLPGDRLSARRSGVKGRRLRSGVNWLTENGLSCVHLLALHNTSPCDKNYTKGADAFILEYKVDDVMWCSISTFVLAIPEHIYGMVPTGFSAMTEDVD